MRKYIFIGVGCFIGATLRYLIESLTFYNFSGIFVINTIIINVLGAFVIAAILTASFEMLNISKDVELGLTTGLLGAFTTFSTMCKETVTFLLSGNYLLAFIYVSISIILGISFAYFGFKSVQIILKKCKCKIVKKESD